MLPLVVVLAVVLVRVRRPVPVAPFGLLVTMSWSYPLGVLAQDPRDPLANPPPAPPSLMVLAAAAFAAATW